MYLAAEGSNPLVPSGGEIILGTIAFALLCVVLMKKALPQAEKIYQERRDAIEGGLERAERAQQEAQATLAQYRAQLADARSEASRIREQAHEDAKRIVAEMRADAERDREERRQRFEGQLAAERTQAIAQLRHEVGGIALQLAERVIGRELENDDRQRELVDDFISGLESSPNGSTAAASAPAGS
ncbi:MAG TPA: F0F1 ATP synthase subunit B [Frankiaceae bacterium]|nr:F0F1 ATP synthase subunit B [Frankiaceae bacterium]